MKSRYEADPDTKNARVSSGYLGMSASADVVAPVVYAHSGNPEDYAVLRRNGIDVRGKVVLVRYSNPYSYRGFKALTAEREGRRAFSSTAIRRRTGGSGVRSSRTAPGAPRATSSAAPSRTTSSYPATR